MSWLRTLLGIVALVTLGMVVYPPSVLAIEVRSRPGMTYEVIANVPPGSVVAVAQEQDWYKIQLPDGREGWIHRFYMGQGQPPSVQEQPPSRTAPVVATPPATPSPAVATPPATPSATAPPAASAMPSKAQQPAVTPSRPVETVTAPPMSRRTALVIGNGAYPMGPLQNAVKDATDITAMLRRLSFEVIPLQNASLQEMEDAVNAFNQRLREGGMGLFYYAGHGVQVEGENYLIPINARIARQADVRYQALPMGRIMGAMEDANNGLNLLILDACRDTPFTRSWRSSQEGLAPPPTTARGMLIAYATSPGGRAADGTGGENGVYTKYLLQAMTVPGLSIEQVFKQVRYGVVAETGGKQTPWESSSLLGDFAFMPAQANIVPAGAPPYPSASSDPETVLWSMSERSSHPEDVLAFLQAYPESRFAPAARLRLQQLQQQQSATASNVPSAPLPGPATPSGAAGFSPSPSPSAPPQPSVERAVPSNVPSSNMPREGTGRNNSVDRSSPIPSSDGYTLIRRIYCEDTESGVIKGSKDLIFTSYLSCEEAKSSLLVLEQQKGNCSFIDKGGESRQKANEWIGTPSCQRPS
jgi:Caspase domain/Bacterial SH3 domain